MLKTRRIRIALTLHVRFTEPIDSCPFGPKELDQMIDALADMLRQTQANALLIEPGARGVFSLVSDKSVTKTTDVGRFVKR